MGRYLNPGNYGFESIRAGEYIDKSEMIAEINRTLYTKRKLICISRARRFGKSFAAQMLAAYYDRSCDSSGLFDDLQIAEDESYQKYLNRFNIIYLDITRLIGDSGRIDQVVPELIKRMKEDVVLEYPSIMHTETLTDVLAGAVEISGIPFYMIIDEWDALFREAKDDRKVQDSYVNLLRTLFKDSGTTDRIFAGVYMTGILPIKKYGTQSAVSDFYEYTMADPGKFAEYFGFTAQEVKGLCDRHHMDFEQMQAWYDGYYFPKCGEIYNPNSVMQAIDREHFGSYWTQTDSYESLRVYLDMDFDGLQQSMISMLGGGKYKIDIGTFQNDMISIANKDDVLTLLVHLGYLAYDQDTEEVSIPNEEIRREFVRTVRNGKRTELVKLVRASDRLLAATVQGDEEFVAGMIAKIHETGVAPLWYNDEQSLRYVIRFAYLSAIDEYLRIEELPAGHGYADVLYLPKKNSNKPILLVELKWNKTADSAIEQIKKQHYPKVLEGYAGEMLLVGVSYNEKNKEHTCKIENY